MEPSISSLGWSSKRARRLARALEKREGVIDDEADIVATAATIGGIPHAGVAHPDPHAAQGTLLNTVVERDIVLGLDRGTRSF